MPSAVRLVPYAPVPTHGFKPHLIEIDLKSCSSLMNIQEVHTSVSGKARRPSFMAGILSTFESGLPSAYIVVNSLVRMSRKDAMKCYSGATSSVAEATYNPVFDVRLIVGAEGSSLLVLSVFSKSNNALAEDIFLGQVTIDLSQLPQLYKGETIEFEQIKWGHAAHTVIGGSDKELSVVDVEGSGTVTFSLTVPIDTESTCGEFYDIKTNELGYFLSVERIFVILHGRRLLQYNNRCQERLEKSCDDVTVDVKDVEQAEMEMTTTKIPMKGLKFTFKSEVCEWAWIHDQRVPQADVTNHMESFRLALSGIGEQQRVAGGSDSGSDSGRRTMTKKTMKESFLFG